MSQAVKTVKIHGSGLLNGATESVDVVTRDSRFVTIVRRNQYLRFRLSDGLPAGSNGSCSTGYRLDNADRVRLGGPVGITVSPGAHK
jgi:hypothetical protein